MLHSCENMQKEKIKNMPTLIKGYHELYFKAIMSYISRLYFKARYHESAEAEGYKSVGVERYPRDLDLLYSAGPSIHPTHYHIQG